MTETEHHELFELPLTTFYKEVPKIFWRTYEGTILEPVNVLWSLLQMTGDLALADMFLIVKCDATKLDLWNKIVEDDIILCKCAVRPKGKDTRWMTSSETAEWVTTEEEKKKFVEIKNSRTLVEIAKEVDKSREKEAGFYTSFNTIGLNQLLVQCF